MVGCYLLARFPRFQAEIEIEDQETTEGIIEDQCYAVSIMPDLDTFTPEEIEQELGEIFYSGQLTTIQEVELLIKHLKKHSEQDIAAWNTMTDHLRSALHLLFKYYPTEHITYVVDDESNEKAGGGIRGRSHTAIERMIEKGRRIYVVSSYEP